MAARGTRYLIDAWRPRVPRSSAFNALTSSSSRLLAVAAFRRLLKKHLFRHSLDLMVRRARFYVGAVKQLSLQTSDLLLHQIFT